MRKAQVSIEVLTAFGLLFLVFISILGIFLQTRLDIFKSNEIINIRTECIKLANIITEAYVHDDGIEITKKINYNASIIPESRVISVQNKQEIFCTIPFSNVSKTDLIKGEIKIKNIDNFVIVENV